MSNFPAPGVTTDYSPTVAPCPSPPLGSLGSVCRLLPACPGGESCVALLLWSIFLMLLRPCPVPPGAWFRQCRCPQGAGVTTSRIISKQKAGRGSVQTSPEHGKTLGKVFRDRAGCVHIGPAGESDPVTLRAAKPQSRREETPIKRPRFAQQILHPPQQFVVQGMAPVRNPGNWGGGNSSHPTSAIRILHVEAPIGPCPQLHQSLSPSP